MTQFKVIETSFLRMSIFFSNYNKSLLLIFCFVSDLDHRSYQSRCFRLSDAKLFPIKGTIAIREVVKITHWLSLWMQNVSEALVSSTKESPMSTLLNRQKLRIYWPTNCLGLGWLGQQFKLICTRYNIYHISTCVEYYFQVPTIRNTTVE